MHVMLKRVLLFLMAFVAMAPAVAGQMASGIPPHGKLVRLFNGKDFTGFDVEGVEPRRRMDAAVAPVQGQWIVCVGGK